MHDPAPETSAISKSSKPDTLLVLISCSTSDVEGNVGDDVQEENTELEDRHSGVVKHVELLN